MPYLIKPTVVRKFARSCGNALRCLSVNHATKDEQRVNNYKQAQACFKDLNTKSYCSRIGNVKEKRPLFILVLLKVEENNQVLYKQWRHALNAPT